MQIRWLQKYYSTILETKNNKKITIEESIERLYKQINPL